MFHSHRKMMASEAPKILCNIGISGAFFVFMKKIFY